MADNTDNQHKPGQKKRMVFVSMAVAEGARAAPLGAAQVMAWLYKQAELRDAYSFELIESTAADALDKLAARIIQSAPELLGLSLYSWNRQPLTMLAARLRAALPGLLILAGGPEASGAPEACLADGVADFVVQGEGELACAAFLNDHRNGRLPPKHATDDQKIYRQPIADLSVLPSPWLDGVIKGKDGVVWELTRGCPYQCAFCYESRGAGKRSRAFPEERLEKELRLFVKHGIREIFVLDPTFNADSRRMKRLLSMIRRLAPDIFFQFELRAELLSAEQAAWLSGVNCQVQLGLQSSKPAILKQLGRNFDPTGFAEKIGLLEDQGIIYGLDLMYGLPSQTLADFRESLDYALYLRPNHLDIFPLAVLPGTALAADASVLQLRYDPTAPHIVRSSPDFPPADMGLAGQLAAASELFYNQGRAVMWFLPLCTALGQRPTEVLSNWGQWWSHQTALPAAHNTIEDLQLDFLSGFLPGKLDTDTIKLATDLIRVSGAWTRAIAEGEESRLELDWQPEDLLDLATQDFDELLEAATKKAGRWLCLPGSDGPVFRRI